ncbi:putative toxin [Sphingobacterium thalpophilum]|uniref:putative toxin n=1 Tax=Sphingobacterium thalpophilum TaxID=259 RepID=UPI002D78FF17|nr:putative toxin [Sphingobacterium thalpophilum]
MLNRQGGSYSYTLTDHLGNTRAVINRNKLPSGLMDVMYHADYYPYGMEVRSGGIDSRYGYQGLYAEKDKETGWNSFELRNYDPAVGRWLTVDPMAQYVSPYVGMGNNPVSLFDPTGGWSDDGLWGWFKGIFASEKKDVAAHYKLEEVKISRFYNKSQITEYKPNFWERWRRSSNFFVKVPYDMLDVPYVYATGFLSFGRNARHLGGTGADPKEYHNAGVMTVAMSLGPIATEAKAMASVKPVVTQLTLVEDAAQGGIANSRALGLAGEQAVGLSGAKTAIQVGGRTRIPDALTRTTLTEVKNVKSLSFTRQLRDFHTYSQQNGLDFILYTRPNTTLSGPLQQAISNGSIITSLFHNYDKRGDYPIGK